MPLVDLVVEKQGVRPCVKLVSDDAAHLELLLMIVERAMPSIDSLRMLLDRNQVLRARGDLRDVG